MLSIVSGTRGVALKADVTSIFIGELYFCCSQPPGSLHLFSFCGNSDSSRISASSNGSLLSSGTSHSVAAVVGGMLPSCSHRRFQGADIKVVTVVLAEWCLCCFSSPHLHQGILYLLRSCPLPL